MKKLTGIVFHDEFRTMDQASPRITLWQDGSIDKKAKPALLLIAEEEEQLPEVMTKEDHDKELAFVRENAAAWEKSCKEAYEAQERLSKRDDEQTAELISLRERVPEWISVKDRMPEPNIEVLVAFEDDTVPGCSQWTKVRPSAMGWLGPAENKNKVITHWMPLPKAPHQ